MSDEAKVFITGLVALMVIALCVVTNNVAEKYIAASAPKPCAEQSK